MKQILHIAVFFAAILAFVGCTPTSQNLAKKAEVTELGRVYGNVEGDAVAKENPEPIRLDWATRNIINSYGTIIKRYSRDYGFDWRLTLAIMKAESSFLDSAVSPVGAEGLMQIMPATQSLVARALDLESVTEPQHNIRAGIYYLSRLYRLFDSAEENDRIRLTLAAYNAGPGRVFDAQDIARFLHESPNRWGVIRDALPLLSSRYSTLHQHIWESQRPRSGFFANSKETIGYVEKVMDYYDEYRLILD